MLVQGAVPGSRVTFAPEAGTDARDYRVAFAKLRRAVPAAVPEWTVEAGIHEVAAAYAAIGLTLEDLTGPRFTRLARINELKAEGRLDDDLRWVLAAPGGQSPAGSLAAGDASHG